MTGINDLYEPPPAPELTLTTVTTSPETEAQMVIAYLEAKLFLPTADVERV